MSQSFLILVGVVAALGIAKNMLCQWIRVKLQGVG